MRFRRKSCVSVSHPFIGQNQEVIGYNLDRNSLVLAWAVSANLTDSGLLCPKKLYVAPTGHLAISSSCGKVHRLFLIDPNQPHTIFSEVKMDIPNTEEAQICPSIGGLVALAVDESGRAKLWSGDSHSRELISNPIVPNMPPLNLVCPTGGSLFAAILTNPRPAVAVYRAESRHKAGTRLHSLVVFSGEFVGVSRLGQRLIVLSRDYDDNFLVKVVFPDGPLVYVNVGNKEVNLTGISFNLHASTKLEGNAYIDLTYEIKVEANLSNSKAGPASESKKATQSAVSSWNEIELDRFGNFPAAALKIELEGSPGSKEISYKLEPRIKKERVIDALVSNVPYFHLQSFGSTGLIAAKYYYGHLYVEVYVENRFIWRFVEPLNAAPKAVTFSMTAPYRHDSRISAYLLMPPSGVIGEQLLHLRGSQGEFLIRRFVFPANGVRKISAVGSVLILQGDTDILIADSEDTGMATARIPNVIEHFVHPVDDTILFVGISEDKYNIEFHNITIDQFSNKILVKKVGTTSFDTRLNGVFGCRAQELPQNLGKLACGFASVGVRIKTLVADFKRESLTMVTKLCDLDLPLASEATPNLKPLILPNGLQPNGTLALASSC